MQIIEYIHLFVGGCVENVVQIVADQQPQAAAVHPPLKSPYEE
jgi:hypothetical protein